MSKVPRERIILEHHLKLDGTVMIRQDRDTFHKRYGHRCNDCNCTWDRKHPKSNHVSTTLFYPTGKPADVVCYFCEWNRFDQYKINPFEAEVNDDIITTVFRRMEKEELVKLAFYLGLELEHVRGAMPGIISAMIPNAHSSLTDAWRKYYEEAHKIHLKVVEEHRKYTSFEENGECN